MNDRSPAPIVMTQDSLAVVNNGIDKSGTANLEVRRSLSVEAELSAKEPRGQSAKLVHVPELQAYEQKALRHGMDATQALLKAFRKEKFVGVGENHFLTPQMRTMVKDALPALKAEGLKYLAVEISDDLRPQVDQFMKTGYLDKRVREGSLGDATFVAMLNEARRLKLTIVPIDLRHAVEDVEDDAKVELRDERMFRHLYSLRKANPDAGILYFAGSYHLEDERRRDCTTAVAKLRRAGIKLQTFAYLGSGERRVGEGVEAYLSLNRPLSVQRRFLARLPDVKATYFDERQLRRFDHVVFWPVSTDTTR